MNIIWDIWLCVDCEVIAETGDATSLDYYYEPDEAERRLREIEAGLEALPGLVSDNTEYQAQMECRECGHIDDEKHFVPRVVVEDGEEEFFRECPKCNSYDTEFRDSGRDEFSRRECDCCGSDLAGSRARFAQLIQEDAHANTG